MVNKFYVLIIVLLIAMLFALTSLNRIEEPLKELAQLPRCEENDVVFTKDFMSSIKNYASDYIKSGTGESYFNNHYQYLDTSYSTIDCTFVIKYIFTYDELHKIMSITLRALNSTKYEIIQTNAFLRPVNILITAIQAEQIAASQNVSYNYYNKEIIVSDQTIVYKFYKETLTQGTILVLEIDAQSQQIIKVERPKEMVPIV